MKKRRRLILWGGGLAALVALIALGSRPRPIPVDIAAVVQGTLSVTLDEEGETRVRDRFEISAPVAGRVLRIELEPGDPVLAAESVLATFLPASPVPLDPRQRAEAEAAVEAAEAAVGRVEALHEQAAQERAFAESTLNRLRRLQEEGVSSEEALEMAQLELDTRQEALEAAEFAVRDARGNLALARARLQRFRFRTGDPGTGNPEAIQIFSPVDGWCCGGSARARPWCPPASRCSRSATRANSRS